MPEQTTTTRPVRYFYCHHRKDERSRDGYLSNFYYSPFEEDGIKFETSEHYIMYKKAMLMGDMQTALYILGAREPKEAKALGRCVTPWNQGLWNDRMYGILLDALRLKFTQNKAIMYALLTTRGQDLVEASPDDSIWGIGISVEDAEAGAPWQGENVLGRGLMQIREEIFSEGV